LEDTVEAVERLVRCGAEPTRTIPMCTVLAVSLRAPSDAPPAEQHACGTRRPRGTAAAGTR
jgi:hypothetical protein